MVMHARHRAVFELYEELRETPGLLSDSKSSTDLHRGISHDEFGTFNHSQVGEAELVRSLDQPHSELPHFQQNLPDVYR